MEHNLYKYGLWVWFFLGMPAIPLAVGGFFNLIGYKPPYVFLIMLALAGMAFWGYGMVWLEERSNETNPKSPC